MVTHDLDEAVTLSDRVIVLSAPPSRVVLDHRVTMQRPRDVFSLRELPEFSEHFRDIWRVLGKEFRPDRGGTGNAGMTADVPAAGRQDLAVPEGPRGHHGASGWRQPGGHRLTLIVLVAGRSLLVLHRAGFVGRSGTRIDWSSVQNTNILDPFFLSRPSQIVSRLYDWTFGRQGRLHLAASLWSTLRRIHGRLVVAVVCGFASAFCFARTPRWRCLQPFHHRLNSLPRIAFVPLITMIFGLGLASKVVTAWFIVFFLVFFNTFKGGMRIEKDLSTSAGRSAPRGRRSR